MTDARQEALRNLAFVERCEEVAAAALAHSERVLQRAQADVEHRRLTHLRTKRELDRARIEVRKACGMYDWLDEFLDGLHAGARGEL